MSSACIFSNLQKWTNKQNLPIFYPSDDNFQKLPFSDPPSRPDLFDCMDYSQRYTGHCNCKTDIKEANFFGPNQVRTKNGCFFSKSRNKYSIRYWPIDACNACMLLCLTYFQQIIRFDTYILSDYNSLFHQPNWYSVQSILKWME
jgi:hypothetical protein